MISNGAIRRRWCFAAVMSAALVAGCGSDTAAPRPGTTATSVEGTSLPSEGAPSTPAGAGQTPGATATGQSADALSCDRFTKEALAASVAPQLPGATILEVVTTLQGGGRLDCRASFPPATQGAMGIDFTIQDGYYANGGYVSANSRPDVVLDFQSERARRAAKTYAPDAPYFDTLYDAPDFGTDAYYQDTVYRQNGGSDGGVRTKLILVRQTLPFVVEVTVHRGPTTAAGDLFTQPDARHQLVSAVTKTVLAVIGS